MLRQQLVFFNFRVEPFVVIFKSISFLIKHIDVVKKTVVLLFGLDKSCHDFINVGDSTVILDFFKRMLDDVGVLHILVH